jgi:glyoxylase-like metal-dependent hydrolase (beta-lactamase superfamily II)
MEVLASEAAVNAFENPKAVEFINSYSQLSAGKMSGSLKGFDLEWRTDIQPLTVREGDVIDLGGVSLRVYEMPGHSNCSISAYEPDAGILFGSDSVGIPFSDRLVPAMNTNIEQYLNSLEKLRDVKVNVFCADHYGFITGEEAGNIVSGGLREASAQKTQMYETFRRNDSDIDAAAKEMTTGFYREMPDYFLAPEILEGVYKQTFKYIAKALQAGK